MWLMWWPHAPHQPASGYDMEVVPISVLQKLSERHRGSYQHEQRLTMFSSAGSSGGPSFPRRSALVPAGRNVPTLECWILESANCLQ